MSEQFSDLGLHANIVETVTNLGYTEPTPIQSAIIPAMLDGQDVIGQAQTGTGKTAAFALPIVQRIEPRQGHVQCLVLAPTRELAMQVADAMYKYGSGQKTRVLAVYGGAPYDRQIRRLKQGVEVVVGTPGRLMDLMRRKVLDLSQVSTVVLDEADEMLSMGFVEDIETILDATPDARQTALFSATMPNEIRRLAKKYMHDPQSFTMARTNLTVKAVEQRYYLVNDRDRLAALTRLFEVEEITRAIVFARTRLGTGELANALVARGFPAEVLNGDLSQDARERVMSRFRKDQITVLVATDVAARGLDVDDISHVFNYDLPQDPEVYVHRIGRTGRAGKSGIAISLVSPREQWLLGKIQSYAKQTITKATLPTIAEIEQQREEELLTQFGVWLRRNRCNRERELVARLVEEGHDLESIAAVALKLARAEEKQRPIDEISEVRPHNARSARQNGKHNSRPQGRGRPNEAIEKGMVRLSLSRGRNHGIKVNEVVGTLANYADIPGKSIGRINIQDQHTFVDVHEQFAGKVLAKTGAFRIRKQSIDVHPV